MAYTPEQLSDMQCIRDAALRYCRGVDRLDGAHEIGLLGGRHR